MRSKTTNELRPYSLNYFGISFFMPFWYCCTINYSLDFIWLIDIFRALYFTFHDPKEMPNKIWREEWRMNDEQDIDLFESPLYVIEWEARIIFPWFFGIIEYLLKAG